MVTNAILGWVASMVHAVLGALPAVPVPSWMAPGGAVTAVFSDAGSMGVWFPTTLGVTVLGAVLAAWAIGWGIKLVRIAVSFLTVGGGSAG